MEDELSLTVWRKKLYSGSMAADASVLLARWQQDEQAVALGSAKAVSLDKENLF